MRKDDKCYYLYCHTNKINGKKYIGISVQKPNRRWRNGKGYKRCFKFQKAIDKYGWENFEHEILLTQLTSEEANQKEQEYIQKYNTINNGYNILIGGFNKSQNNEIRFKTKIVNQYSLDKQLIKTWDSVADIERELGFSHQAISKVCNRKLYTAFGYIWRYQDDYDDVNNIIIKNIHCQHNNYNTQKRPINQYDLQGNFIKTWDCILDVAKVFNKPTTLFTNCCNRKPIHNNSQSYFKTAYGYQWRYADDCADVLTDTKNQKCRAVYEIDINNNIIHEFASIQEAKDFYHDNKMLISDVCIGRQRSTKGHIFCYKDKRE